MAKLSVAQLPAKLYELLSPLSPEERVRVVQATMILFGENLPSGSTNGPGGQNQDSVGGTGSGDRVQDNIQTFLDEKNPKNKGEMLAVVARYRELKDGIETHSKADFKNLITSARRNFDDSNFARDINNAKRQAGFFNLGSGRDANKLSYYGQQFVDALPDKDAAAKIKRPKVGGNKKKKVARKKKA